MTNKENEKNLLIFNVKDKDDINKNLKENILNLIKECEFDILEDKIIDIKRLGNKVGKRLIWLTLEDPKLKMNFFDKTDKFRAKCIHSQCHECHATNGQEETAKYKKIIICRAYFQNQSSLF